MQPGNKVIADAAQPSEQADTTVASTGAFIDRAARAAYDEMDWQARRGVRPWFGRSALYRQRFTAGIRAGIAAMREPTYEMLSAADSAIPRFEVETGAHRLMGTDGAEIAWRVMIDAALADGAGNGTASTTDASKIPGITK